MNKLFLLVLGGTVLSLQVQAKTYYCTDQQGNALYSEQPQGKNCRVVNDIGGQFSITAAPESTYNSQNSDASDSSNTADTTLQAQRKQAQRNLTEAKKALEEGKKVRNGNERNYVKYQERIQKLEENVKTRQEELDNLH